MVLKPNICLLLLFSLSLALALTSVSNSYEYDEPQKELHRCQLRCVRQLQPYSKQAECQEQCVKAYKERKEEGLPLEDPQGQLKRCQKQCQEQEHSQQQQCRQTCQEEYEQQQREQEERAQEEGGRRRGDDNPQVEDPQRLFKQCQEQCRRSHRGDQQCQIQCRKEFERQQREAKERERHEGGRGSGEDNPQVGDPRQQYERCQEQCRRTRPGYQQQCQSRCAKDSERQQREQEEREGSKGGGDDNPRVEDPQQQYEQCQEQCRKSHLGDQQQCQSRCAKEFERQQREQEERKHHEGGKRREEDNPQVEDPRQQYKQCQEQCRRYHPHSEEVQEQCQRGCTEEYEERQREQGKQHHDGPEATNHHVEQSYQQCRQACRRERGQRQQYCLQQCERKREEEQREHGREHGRQGNIMERGEEEQQENNPYYFRAPRFKLTFSTQEGHLRVLERFSKRSELLRGIENYRLAILEANPNTFIIPHHYDAESVFAVLQGKGIITLVQNDRRESFNFKEGDVIRIHAGTTVYLINHDDNRKLCVAKLFQPINTPGRFESYFGAGGENPESFYRAFSNEILQAALNTPREKLDRLFGQQRQGVITKATQEQIKALSKHVSSSSRRGKSGGPFNLLKEKPIYSNEFGQFFEASPKDYEQLRDLDLSVAFMNINQGAMIAPYYNTKSTRLVVVVEGTGSFEIACPHLSGRTHGSQGRRETEREERGTHYHKVSAQFSAGDAFIIPAGHPISIIASRNENLKLAGFGINAKNNQKNFLAGQEDNVWKHVESEAKELAFNIPAREVEEIFRNQRQSYFLPGPGQQQEREEERSGSVASSVLDFVSFF